MWVVCVRQETDYVMGRSEIAELLGMCEYELDQDAGLAVPEIRPLGGGYGSAYVFHDLAVARSVAQTCGGFVVELEPYPWG